MVKVKLADVAKRLGKTSVAIARETGINRNTIDALLKGRVSAIKFPTLEKLCSTYQLELTDILELSAPEKPKQSKLKIVHRQYKQEGQITPFTCLPWMLVGGTYQLRDGNKMYGFGPLYLYNKKDYGEVYWDFASLRYLAETVFKRYSNKQQLDKLYNQFLVYAAEIEEVYTALHGIDPERMSEKELQDVFARIRTSYHQFWEHSLFIDAFDVGFDTDAIRSIAKQYTFSPKEVAILTTPEQMTFANERKLALLRIAKKILRGSPKNKKELQKRFQKHQEEISSYIQDFDYYKSNYAHVKHISEQEVEKEIEQYLGKPEKLEKELHELTRYIKQRVTEKRHVLRAHYLTNNPLWFFSHLTYWREFRKKINLMGFHVLDKILLALEAKTGIPKKYLLYLDFDEVNHVLSGLISRSTLKNRYEKGVLIAISGSTKRMFEAEEAYSLRQDLEATLSSSPTQEKFITGQTASPGHAKGVARIILSQNDFARFREGEILVTGMTRPEFLPVMKKAAAIVTNEGGITCHAAIVSRELGKPCIIGTKNATQRIKDGDIIEVRASHGTIRILE